MDIPNSSHAEERRRNKNKRRHERSYYNQAIERERHTMPTLQDFKAEVNGAKFFSKIDLKQAYVPQTCVA